MSNRLKLKGSRPQLPHCASCGRPIPKAMWRKRLPDGRNICTRCAEAGVLCQKLACGHYGVPGMAVAADSGDFSNFQCAQCSPLIDPLGVRRADAQWGAAITPGQQPGKGR